MDKIVSPKPPAVHFGRRSWHLSKLLLPRLDWAARLGLTLTVHDIFGTPGDTISTSTVCRQIRARHPGLKINVVTPNPELLRHDPGVDTLNAPPTLLRLTFWYLDMVQGKARSGNILDPTARVLGNQPLDYKAKVYLSPDEIAWAAAQVGHLTKPIVSINAMSREMVKVWPQAHWAALLSQLRTHASIVQLGDNREPPFEGVTSFAGKLTMRQSMAILSQADVHIGPDSFLMHVANGLDVPSVIIFGGSRPAACLGYRENENLETVIECGPCWIHTSHGQSCPYAVKCMDMISPDTVAAAVHRLLLRRATGGGAA